MRTIYKYPLGERTELQLPASSIVRHLAAQRQNLCLWIEQDITEVVIELRLFLAIATGSPVPSRGQYVGTAAMPDGDVWHVYEIAA